MSAQAYQHYKSTTVAQADPVRLVALLYEGALRNCQLALAALRGEAIAPSAVPGSGGLTAQLTGPVQPGAAQQAAGGPAAAASASAEERGRPAYEAAHNAILKAYAIIAELTATLDTENGGSIAVQLEQLYDYILHLLREADMSKSERPLVEAQELIAGLSRTWAEAFPAGLASVPEEMRGRVGHKRRESQLGDGGIEEPALTLATAPPTALPPGVEGAAADPGVPANLALDLTG